MSGRVVMNDVRERDAVERVVLHHRVGGHIVEDQFIAHIQRFGKGIVTDHIAGKTRYPA